MYLVTMQGKRTTNSHGDSYCTANEISGACTLTTLRMKRTSSYASMSPDVFSILWQIQERKDLSATLSRVGVWSRGWTKIVIQDRASWRSLPPSVACSAADMPMINIRQIRSPSLMGSWPDKIMQNTTEEMSKAVTDICLGKFSTWVLSVIFFMLGECNILQHL